MPDTPAKLPKARSIAAELPSDESDLRGWKPKMAPIERLDHAIHALRWLLNRTADSPRGQVRSFFDGSMNGYNGLTVRQQLEELWRALTDEHGSSIIGKLLKPAVQSLTPAPCEACRDREIMGEWTKVTRSISHEQFEKMAAEYHHIHPQFSNYAPKSVTRALLKAAGIEIDDYTARDYRGTYTDADELASAILRKHGVATHFAYKALLEELRACFAAEQANDDLRERILKRIAELEAIALPGGEGHALRVAAGELEAALNG